MPYRLNTRIKAPGEGFEPFCYTPGFIWIIQSMDPSFFSRIL